MLGKLSTTEPHSCRFSSHSGIFFSLSISLESFYCSMLNLWDSFPSYTLAIDSHSHTSFLLVLLICSTYLHYNYYIFLLLPAFHYPSFLACYQFCSIKTLSTIFTIKNSCYVHSELLTLSDFRFNGCSVFINCIGFLKVCLVIFCWKVCIMHWETRSLVKCQEEKICTHIIRFLSSGEFLAHGI